MKKLIHILAVLLTAVAAPAFAEQYDTNVELNRLPPTDQVILVSLLADKTMEAHIVKVGHITNGTPLLCFKDPDKQLVGCFVVNTKTGQVVFIQLPADETSV